MGGSWVAHGGFMGGSWGAHGGLIGGSWGVADGGRGLKGEAHAGVLGRGNLADRR